MAAGGILGNDAQQFYNRPTSGALEAVLELKVGSLVAFAANICPHKGLMKGQRAIVAHCQDKCVGVLLLDKNLTEFVSNVKVIWVKIIVVSMIDNAFLLMLKN